MSEKARMLMVLMLIGSVVSALTQMRAKSEPNEGRVPAGAVQVTDCTQLANSELSKAEKGGFEPPVRV